MNAKDLKAQFYDAFENFVQWYDQLGRGQKPTKFSKFINDFKSKGLKPSISKILDMFEELEIEGFTLETNISFPDPETYSASDTLKVKDTRKSK